MHIIPQETKIQIKEINLTIVLSSFLSVGGWLHRDKFTINLFLSFAYDNRIVYTVSSFSVKGVIVTKCKRLGARRFISEKKIDEAVFCL